MAGERRSFHLATFALALLGATIFASACGKVGDDITSANLAENCSLDSDCTSPLVCAFQTCHIQCETTADCRAQSLGLCIESDRPYKVCQNPTEENCTRNSDCAGTEVCAADEKCRDACATSKDCVTGQSCVTGVCVDPVDLVDGGLVQTDAGSEGQACYFAHDCPGNLVCLRGTCTVECVTDKDCEISFTCQNTRCTPPSDDTSDAAVSDRMDSSAEDASDAALDSSTICPVGQTYCGLSCIDPTSSDAFCHAAGACGTGCLPGERCTAGVCQCLAPKTLCDGKTCVDLASDSANCRTCDHACTFVHETGTTCVAGTCTPGMCATGFGDCDGDPSNGCEANLGNDTNNCGACSNVCPFQGCKNGQCEIVALAPANSSFVVIDGTNAYFTNEAASGTIQSVPLAGGAVTTLATGQQYPIAIAVDANNVYWGDYGAATQQTGASGLGSVLKVAKTGGVVTTLASNVDPNDIVVQGTNVYWSNIGANPSIMSVPAAGGTVVTVASGLGYPHFLTTDASNVYWTDLFQENVAKAPLAGGTTTVLASGYNGPQGIAVDSTNVYFGTGQTNPGASSDDARLIEVPIAGGSPVTLATGGLFVSSVVVDATYAYYTEGDDFQVRKVPLAQGASILLATTGGPLSIVVDGTSAYWVDQSDGEIVKLTTK